LVIGGILQQTHNTAKCWTMVSKHAQSYGIQVFRTVKTQLENMMRDMGIHRVETENLKDATDQHKWCKLLGFHEEGEMRYYDDKKRTYIRFAKILEI